MKKAYFLGTCNTCKTILRELQLPPDWELIDLKSTPITSSDLKLLTEQAGTYEACFNKRARKYQSMENKNFSEAEWKDLILNEPTFLKRPAFIWDRQSWVGNAAKTIASLKSALHE